MYTGTYFNVDYVNHTYMPTAEATAHFLENFKHKWNVNDVVRFRKKHKTTSYGIIQKKAYSTAKNSGGTIKVYMINFKWIGEECIKGLI